uniref:Uncharacterized protein n=1 Tax=Setaria italica TaxID=4555 RepID=K3YFD8_SETIT
MVLDCDEKNFGGSYSVENGRRCALQSVKSEKNCRLLFSAYSL